MGVNDLWPVLAPGFDSRVSFPVWVSRFVEEHGRPPRVAIDGFMFLFQSRHAGIVEWTDEAVIRNFMFKLVYLSAYNVSYVLVLDGHAKPLKSNRHQTHGTDMEALAQLGECDFSPTLIPKLKSELARYCITFLQCPGEGEAECAMLQKARVVDFVISNDVDTLIFGATQVLRNFSRFKDDKPASAGRMDSKRVNHDFLVTPVRMAKVIEHTGIDHARLVLIASIRGGDYSSGMDKIGITRAVRIALCGTLFASFYSRSPSKTELKERKRRDFKQVVHVDPLPDFSQMLMECFVDPVQGVVHALEAREAHLSRFLATLNASIADRSREIFERRAILPPLSIDESFTMLYLFPRVSVTAAKFKPHSFNYGEGAANTIPSGFDFNIKYLVIKLLSRPKLRQLVRLTKSKDLEGEKFVLLKFWPGRIREVMLLSKQDKADGELPEDEEQSVWLPLNLVSLASPEAVAKFQEQAELDRAKRSPSARKPLQKTTLDMLLPMPNPEVVKCREALSDVAKPNFEPVKMTSHARSSRPRRKSPTKQLLPGQSLVTSFFTKPPTTTTLGTIPSIAPSSPKGLNPFVADSLFVDSSDSDEERRLQSAPHLGYKVPSTKRQISSAGLAETSPTKRSNLELSPDSSPTKPIFEKLPNFQISPTKKHN